MLAVLLDLISAQTKFSLDMSISGRWEALATFVKWCQIEIGSEVDP